MTRDYRVLVTILMQARLPVEANYSNGKAFPFLNCVALNFRFIKFSGALISETLISILLPQILNTPLTFLTPMGRFSFRLSPLVPLGKVPQPKFPFRIIMFHSVSVVSPTFVSNVAFIHFEMFLSLSR